MVCHQPIVIISLQCCCGLVDYNIVDIPEKGFKNSVLYCGEPPFGTRAAAAAAAKDRERSTQPIYINIFIIILCPRSFYCASLRRSLQLLKADYYYRWKWLYELFFGWSTYLWDMSRRSPMDDEVTYVISLIVVGIKMITLNNRIKIAVLGSSRVGKTGKLRGV